MNQYTKLEIGQLFKKDTFTYQEGSRLNFNASGGNLFLYYKSPTSKEVQEIRKGSFNIKLLEIDNILFLLFKFGLESWMDVPFSPHLSKDKDFSPCDINEGMGYSLNIYLIDAKTGILKVMRRIGLSTEISKEFQEVYLNLKGKSFDIKEYDQRLNELYSTHTADQFVQLARFKYE